jgi:putative DNA primase/helicase
VTEGPLEMYDRARFFTVTGVHLAGTPLTVEARPREVAAVHAEHLGEDPVVPSVSWDNSPATSLSDSEIVDKAHAARNGPVFAALWRGDTNGHPTPSEADLALCSHLAFWCGPDPVRIDRMFRRSGLYRGKWDEQRGRQT